MNMAKPKAKGRVRNPSRRAKLPKNSVNIPTRLRGTGMPYFSFQLARTELRPRPSNQPKICCEPWAKNATARPKRKNTNEKDGDVSKIQLIRILHESSIEMAWSLAHYAAEANGHANETGANPSAAECPNGKTFLPCVRRKPGQSPASSLNPDQARVQCQSFLLASRAPSASARNFAQTTLGW